MSTGRGLDLLARSRNQEGGGAVTLRLAAAVRRATSGAAQWIGDEDTGLLGRLRTRYGHARESVISPALFATVCEPAIRRPMVQVVYDQ